MIADRPNAGNPATVRDPDALTLIVSRTAR